MDISDSSSNPISNRGRLDFAIQLDSVFHRYESPPYALSIPLLAIRRGEAISIIGRSGTGKTTLLSLILGLATPERGQILIEGSSPERARRSGVFGVAFQNATLLPWLSVSQNISLPWRLNGGIVDPSKVDDLLAGVGLIEYRNAYPSDLSGGMRSRVALARALACSPQILVLDEPFSSLDEITRMEMAALVSVLQEHSKSTLIFVTHNLTEALLISDRILLLGKPQNGSGRPAVIFDEFSVPFRNRKPEFSRSEAFRNSHAELADLFMKEEKA